MKKIIFLVFGIIIMTANTFAEAVSGFKVDYWVGNIKGGIAYPVDNFANYVTPLYNFGVSVRKGLDMELTVGGGITYAVLPYKNSEGVNPFNATILDLEAAFTPYLPDFFIWPYVKFGLGVFMIKYAKLIGAAEQAQPTTSSENTLGIMLGGGGIYPIGNQFGANLEILYNYCSMAGGTGDVASFLTADLGVVIYLK
jgi:hypothetical protein